MIDADAAVSLKKRLISIYDMENEVFDKLPNNKDDWDIKNNPEHALYFGMMNGLSVGKGKIESFLGEHAFPKDGEEEKEFRDLLKLTEEMFAEEDE